MKPTQPPPGLIRALGPFMAIAVVVGTVIGSGVFLKPYTIAGYLAESGLVALVWAVAGLLVFFGALAYAEVAVLLPRAGGNYVYLREGYGRLAGFLWGWVDLGVIRSASVAALATAFSESFSDVLSAFGPRLTAWGQALLTLGVILGLGLVNARGTRWGGGLQLALTLVKIGLLLAIAVLPFLALWYVPADQVQARPEVGRLSPVWPANWWAISLSGVGGAFLAVLWAYHGWMNIAPVAEEIQTPQRNLPLALLAGVGIIIALYLAANLAYALIIPHDEMKDLKNTTVVARFGERLLGPTGKAFAAAAVMCSVFGALNGNLLVGPRTLYAMGRDGLAPQALQAIHPRFHTPARAIAVLAAWASFQVLVVALLTEAGLHPAESPFDTLTNFAMFGAVIFETLAVVSLFVFRFQRPDAPRPYRCPGYPVVPALYILLPGIVLYNFLVDKQLQSAVGVAYIGLGVLLYFALGLGRTGAALPPSPREDDAPEGRFEEGIVQATSGEKVKR